MRFKREVLCKLESAPPHKLHEHRWFLEERKGQGNFEDGGQILVILLSNPCSPCHLQAPGWDLYWAGTSVLNKRLAGMIWVGEGEGGINSPCGFAALRAWHLSAVCGPLGACQTRHPWNHRATGKAGWGGASGNVLILSIARCHHAHTHGRQWGSRGGEGKVDGFMGVKLQVLPDGSHAWGWPWAKPCGRKVCFHSCHSLHFIIFSIPAPSHPQIHTHTSHPATCPMTCPTLHLGAHLPAPQGSHHLSLILLPDLWLSISHQPPSAPQSVCPTLADITSSSLTLTLVWTPPCIIMFRAQMCLPVRRQFSWSWRPCLILFAIYSEPSGAGTTQGASWTFRNVLSFLPVPCTSCTGSHRVLSVHESWVGSGGPKDPKDGGNEVLKGTS